MEQIAQYQSLQKALTVHFPHHQPSQAMWYLINEDGDQQLLNASQLRSTMKYSGLIELDTLILDNTIH